MVVFSQLLIGSFYVTVVAVVSWVIGALMGIALAKFATIAPAKHADVTELLKRERQAAAASSRTAQASPGGTIARPTGAE